MWTYGVDGLGNFKDLTIQEKSMTEKIDLPEATEIPAISWN